MSDDGYGSEALQFFSGNPPASKRNRGRLYIFILFAHNRERFPGKIYAENSSFRDAHDAWHFDAERLAFGRGREG